jgi:outer membrane protein assembly factor BamB/pSer/pThr/pTyr-binding forkhead associated (FHA) protein
MAELELRTGEGRTERRVLSRSQPLSIGRQPVNDIVVAEDAVGSLHCRIGWTKTGYEVTAASRDGVDLNGKLVQHALLKSGDVLRIGSVDAVFQDIEMSQDRNREKSKERVRDRKGRSAEKSERSSRGRRGKADEVADDADELSLFEGEVLADSAAEALFEAEEEIDPSEAAITGIVLDRSAKEGEVVSRGGKPVGAQEPQIATELRRSVRAALNANRVRPGEQDVFRSPLVLGLGGGGLVVILVTATLWFLMGRQVAQRLFDRGNAELNEAKYTQAIATFESFAQKYPKHKLSADARLGIGKAKIQREIAGATPNWKRGLEELETFISDHRNEEDFKTLQPGICGFAEQIALGSVKSAETLKDPALISISADATRRLEQFSDPEQPPTAALEAIRVGTEQAHSAIRKQQAYDAAFVIIDQALKDKRPIDALQQRARLLQNYPDLANQRRVRDAMQKAIDLEKSVIAVEEIDRPAVTEETPIDPGTRILPIYHTRSRTDEAASGRYAYAVAKDALFAVDTVTGEPAWRRIVGFDPPFFPVPTSGAQPGLLIGETDPHGLALRHAETGALIWRQPLESAVSGAPLVHEGEIFVPAGDHALYRLDLDTGKLKAKMTFSQNVIGPPTVAPDGAHVILPGETALLYTLTLRPLEVAAVTFSEHSADSVNVPMLTMGGLVLLCENDQLDSCRLRCFDATKPDQPLVETAKPVRIDGQVVDRPVLRGPQLVVPATGERLYAYAVSDNPEKKGLAAIGLYKIQQGYQGPMELALGPDQQFWLASSAFRKFQVLNDSIRLDPESTAPGIASQPLQIIGDQFFVGRRPPYAEAVVFTQVDRERMAGSWRTTLGARLLAWTEARGGGLIAVSETGSLFTLSSSRLKEGGAELRSGTELEIPADVTEPLGATRLSDGRLVLWCNGPQPKLWLINSIGQVESEHKLEASLDAAPVLLKGGLVLPQPGRLKWLSISRETPSVQDFAAPVHDGETVRWAFLVGLDDKEFVACDRQGRLSRMQIRQDEVVHLAEAAKFQLPQPVDVPPLLVEQDLWITDASGTLRRLDSRSFDVKGERQFPKPVRGLWAEGEQRFAQLSGGVLHALSEEEGLPDRWTADFGEVELLGSPIQSGGQFLWVGRGGSVLMIDPANGQIAKRWELPQPLTLGLINSDGNHFASAADGAIYRITPPAGGDQ